MHHIAFAISAILSLFIALPAWAQGEVVITHAKALAGNVTPGDTPGYPVHLTRPGKYVLGSNLPVTANQYGINVYSHNVDIDMNGFTLSGAGQGSYGVISSYGESRIHDGFINGFRSTGMYLRNNAWTIEDMQITRNGSHGVDATGARLIEVRNSVISKNNSYGIASGDSSLFRGNKISENAYMGIDCRESCHVEGNIIENNEYGVQIFSGLVIGNTIARNRREAIYDAGSTNTDVGLSNNMLILNNEGSGAQVVRTIDVHPNTCFGNPCRN